MARRWLIIAWALTTLGITIAGWWLYSGPLLAVGGYAALKAWGRLTGLLAVWALLWQFLLIARLAFMEKALSLDKALVWHHWGGFLSLMFIVVHPIFLAVAYAGDRTTFWGQTWSFLTSWENMVPAFIAYALFIGAVILSLQLVKKKLRYEWWYLTHLSLYLAVFMAFGHQLESGGDFLRQPWFRAYWLAFYVLMLGLFAWHRFIRPLVLLKKHNFKVARVVAENESVWSVYITGQDLASFPIKAGQFVIVRFLTADWWTQAHPFSLSTVPDGKELRITIKALGDYTSKIKNLPIGVSVLVDGPHGAMTVDNAVTNKIVLIAGGIGITPLRALAEDFLRVGKDVVLLCATRGRGDQVFTAELTQLTGLKYACAFSGEPITDDNCGFIDERALDKLVPDWTGRDIYYCGPPPMMKGLTKLFAKRALTKRQLHWEKFSF